MAISFESLQDPYGIRQAGSTLGQALMQRGMMDRQKAQELEQRKQNASAFTEAMQSSSKPGVSTEEKIAALQNYAAMTGDNATVAPLLKQIISESTKQQESQNALDFLRSQGIDIPENINAQNAPPASFLGQFAKGQKKTYEPESEKLEAQRTAELADKIVKDYQAAETSRSRLGKMEIAAESGQLPTPALIKTLEFFGLPLGIINNPLGEAYDKESNEYIKDISNYFPGQIRVAEIEPFMKTIPTLLNSDEGKKLIIKSQQLINKQKTDTYDAYKQILKENNGKKPQNLDVEVLDRTQNSREEVGEQLKDVFREGVEITQFPTKKVAEGTKIDNTTALQYIKRAKGDRQRAEQLAKDDGYVF